MSAMIYIQRTNDDGSAAMQVWEVDEDQALKVAATLGATSADMFVPDVNIVTREQVDSVIAVYDSEL